MVILIMTGTEADSKLLRKAVKEDALQQIIRPLMNWYSYPSVYFIEYLLSNPIYRKGNESAKCEKTCSG